MATIANLAVSLTARIGNFEKGFKKAEKVSQRFSRNLTRHIKTVSGYGAAIGGLATGALSLAVKKQLGLIDSTAKLADVLGLATQELVGLQLGADITGVQLSQLNTGITRFQKNIGDAGDGLAAPIRSLKKLNLTASQLKLLSTFNQIKLVADRFGLLENQIDKSNVLLNLFGRSGLAIGKLLETGSVGIERFLNEAENIGIAFDRVDASKVEEANDAMTRAKRVMTGFVNKIAIELAPFIQVASDRLREFGMQGNLSGEAVVNSMNYIVESISNVAKALDLINFGSNSFSAGVNTIATGAAKLVETKIGKLNSILHLFGIDKLDNLHTTVMQMTNGYYENLDKSVKKINGSFDNLANNTAANSLKTFFNGILTEVDKINSAIGNGPLGNPTGGTSGSGEPGFESSVKTRDFRQIDLERVVVGSGRSTRPQKQVVEDPQLQETNQLLKAMIKRNGVILT